MIAPIAGPAVDQRTARHVLNIAKRLDAQLFVVPGASHTAHCHCSCRSDCTRHGCVFADSDHQIGKNFLTIDATLTTATEQSERFTI